MDTQTQIDRLIELAIVQRSELKQLVSELPQLREYLGAEIERTFEEAEPQIRTELEEFCRARATDEHAKTGAALAAKVEQLSKQLEVTTAAKYSVLMAERAENANLLAKAEARIEDAASMLTHAVKEIVTDELSRFPRAGEIDQLRKEFAEPRGLNPRGRWQVGETYNKLDLVSYNGDSYVSNTDGNSEKPSRSSAAWTLSAARGNGGAGGGVTSMTDLVPVPANGELLIGNGSAFVNATLTAGTGISISNGPGSITINATDGNITLDDGTASAPSLNFTDDPNTGLYRPAADTVGIVGGGHDILRLTDIASATDYVQIKNGIGVGSPIHILAEGASANIGMHLQPKGSGLLTISDGTDFNKGIRFRSSSSAASAVTLLDAVSTAGRVITLPDATDTLVGRATTDTLTNKTLTSPTLTTPISATLTAPAATNLTLSGGSTGASLVLGQGATAANVTLNATTSGFLSFTKSEDSITPSLARLLNAGATTAGRYNEVIFGKSLGNGGAGTIGYKSDTATPANSRLFLVHYGINQDTGGIQITNVGNVLIGGTTDITGSGGLKVFGTTAASTSQSGAFQVGGSTAALSVGIGGGNINAGGTGTFGGILRTTASSAAIILDTAGAWIQGPAASALNLVATSGNGISFFPNGGSAALSITSGSIVNVPGTTSASSSTTGALTIGNGTAATNVAIGGGNVNAGGTGTFGTNATGGILRLGGTAPSADQPAEIFLTTSNTAFNWKVLTNTSGPGIFELRQSTAGGGTTFTDAILRITPNVTASASAVGIGGIATIASTTASTGVGTGALQVAGGIYAGAASVFGGAVTTGGDITASANASVFLRLTSANNNAAPGTIYTSGNGGSLQTWLVGSNVSGASGEFAIRDSTAVANALTITKSTLAATFAGTVIAPAATASLAPLRIPHGTAPTSPTNGDMWTTTAGLYIRINGATVGPLS